MPNISTSKQALNTALILIGAALMVYDFVVNPDVIYFKIGGLVILMFGLYKSTQQWTLDNTKNSADEDENAPNHE